MTSVLDSTFAPQEWRRTKLRSFLTRRKQTNRPDLHLLSVNLPNGVVPRHEGDGRVAPSLDLSGYQEVRPNDLVMNQLGKPHGAVGVSDHHGIISPAYFVAEISDEAEPRFVHHLLRTRLYISEYERRGKCQPPSQFDISWEQFRDIGVALPPPAEQRAIADYLDTETARIDTLITKKRHLIALLTERRARVTLAGVTGGLTGNAPTTRSSIPWVPQIPHHWGAPKIGYVATLGSGHTPSRSVPEWWVPEECTIPWITTGEVANLRSDRIEYIEHTRECVSEIGLANSSAVVHPAGTVVLCRTASAGYSGIMATEMATSQDFATWTCGPHLLPRFLLLCLRAMRPDLLGRLATGSTHKTIYMPDIQSLAIPLPPIAEQREIVNAVWRQLIGLGEAEDRIAEQNLLLFEQRQALITAAVTGDLSRPTRIASLL